MPICFQLIDKSTGKPVLLEFVDYDLREHFGDDLVGGKWFRGWYNTIGLGLAIGHSFDQLREIFGNHPLFSHLVEIVDYLDQHYQSSAWKS